MRTSWERPQKRPLTLEGDYRRCLQSSYSFNFQKEPGWWKEAVKAIGGALKETAHNVSVSFCRVKEVGDSFESLLSEAKIQGLAFKWTDVHH